METRSRYCFDLDGVVANFHDGFMDLLRKEGVDIPEGYVPEKWDWYYDFAGRQPVDRAWRKIQADPSWWYHRECFLDREAVENLEYLADKHDIIFLSARSLCPSNIAQAWVNDNIGPYTTIVVDSPSQKYPVLFGLDVSLYVDDHIITLKGMSQRQGIRLFTVPWPYTNGSGFEAVEINKLIRSLK